MKIRAIALACLAGLALPTAAQAQNRLILVNTQDLFSICQTTNSSFIGNNPSSIELVGNRLFVGGLSLADSLTFDVTAFDTSAGPYPLITSLTPITTPSNPNWTLINAPAGSRVYVEGNTLYAVVPEPTSLALLVPAGLLLTRRRR
jgi:hypothetical protein